MPNIDEMVNDPRAADEGLQKARSLPEGHLAELVQTQKKESEDATREIRDRARIYYDYWMNNVDFRDKEDWQTQLWVPKVFTAVEQATALVQRSLLESPDAFGIDGNSDRDRVLATMLWRPWLRLVLDKTGFVYKFADAAKLGFITGVAGYLKIRPISSRVPKLMRTEAGISGSPMPVFDYTEKLFMAIDLIPMWNIFRDPYSLPRKNYSGTYLYHSEWKDKGSLFGMADNGWDAEKVKELLQTGGSSYQSQSGYSSNSQWAEAERKQYYLSPNKFRKMFLIDEGWLDILDENGDPIFPNALMVHSNRKILYGPVANPLWATDLTTGRRKWPIIAGTPIIHPSRFEGRGIVEQDAPLSHLYSNVFMLWADGLNWVVNPPTEVQQDILVDWEDLDHYPGRLWVKRGSGQALQPAEMGRMNTNEVMGALQYIDQVRQNSNFVTDFAVGLPGSRSDITKGEVQIKTAQSLAIFEAMGKNLELFGKEAIALIYDMMLQFFNPTDEPALVAIIGPQVAQAFSTLPIEQKIAALQGDYEFIFTGVSQALQKSDQLQKLMQFATLSASPMYANRVDPGNILRVIGDVLGITDRVQIINPPPQPPPQLQTQMPGMSGPAAAPTGAPQQPQPQQGNQTGQVSQAQ